MALRFDLAALQRLTGFRKDVHADPPIRAERATFTGVQIFENGEHPMRGAKVAIGAGAIENVFQRVAEAATERVLNTGQPVGGNFLRGVQFRPGAEDSGDVHDLSPLMSIWGKR